MGYERTRSLILFPLLTGDGKRKVKEKSHPLSHSSVTSAISAKNKSCITRFRGTPVSSPRARDITQEVLVFELGQYR